MNNVIPFPAQNNSPGKSWIVLPKNDLPNSQYFTHTIKGQSLEFRGIYDGDVLICREIHSIRELKNHKIYVVEISGFRTIRALRFNNDETVTFYSANQENTGHLSDFKIHGVCLEIQRPII